MDPVFPPCEPLMYVGLVRTVRNIRCDRLSLAGMAATAPFLANKVGINELHLRRRRNQLATHILAFEEICHVVAQYFHGLYSFQILMNLLRNCPMHHVPVT